MALARVFAVAVQCPQCNQWTPFCLFLSAKIHAIRELLAHQAEPSAKPSIRRAGGNRTHGTDRTYGCWLMALASRLPPSYDQPMAATDHYLGIDLGASSGRAVLGAISRSSGRPPLRLREIHRFTNAPVTLPFGLRPPAEGSSIHWNLLAIWHNIQHALKLCAGEKLKISSVAVDAWAQDLGLLDADGRLLGNPFCYRDARTAGCEKLIAHRIDPQRVFDIAGQAPHPIYNLADSFADPHRSGPATACDGPHVPADPRPGAYFLCGRPAAELTIASTCQFLDLAGGLLVGRDHPRLRHPAAHPPTAGRPRNPRRPAPRRPGRSRRPGKRPGRRRRRTRHGLRRRRPALRGR